MTQTVTNNSGAPLPLGEDYISQVSAVVGGGQSGGAGGVDTTAMLNQLCQTLDSPNADSAHGTSGNAPELASPLQGFTTEDMALLLTSLRAKTFDEQIKVGKQGLEIDAKRTQDINERTLKKIQEWVDKCKEADEKDKAGGVFGWIAKIFSFIAAAICTALAAVATVATGGAAAPLLAVSCVLLASTTLSLASAISQQCGGPALEPSSWLTGLMTKMLVGFGMNEEQAKSLGKVLAGVAVGVCTMGVGFAVDPELVGNMASGIAELCGASKEASQWIGMAFTIAAMLAVMVVTCVVTGGASMAKAVADMEKIARIAMNVGRAMAAAAGVTAGVGDVGQGAMKIEAADAQRSADKAMADKKELAAFLVKLQKLMEDGREDLKKIMQAVDDMMTACIRMLNSTSDSHQQLLKRMGSENASLA